MQDLIRQGSEVKWQWGEGEATGHVVEVFKQDVTRTIKGTEVKRQASQDCPAYLIKQQDGDKVLKSRSELI